MTSPSTLVIGYSEQLPNELRAYRLMGKSSGGAVLLGRHGATYSAAANDVCAYPELLERMLGLVLASFPSSLRERARPTLIRRWNHDWGVEAEDLIEASANDNRASSATETFETVPSRYEPARPRIQADGSSAPQAALAAN